MEQLHIQPSEIDNMQYWEYEITLEEYEKILKERKEEQDKQQEASNMSDPMKMGNSMMRQAQSSMKMPSMPKLNIPKL